MNDMTDGLRARRRANLRRMLHPRRIAFVGGRHLESCIALARRAGFAGVIDAVNPRRAEIAGIACAPAIADLPEAPDAAFLALPREATAAAVSALAGIGAGGAICHAAGFAELGGAHRERQNELAAAAGDLALIGPNCMGMINAFDRAVLWGTDGHFEPVDGPGVAVISQSGAFLFGIANVERAYPMGYGLSLGNQAVVDAADVLDAVLDDTRVRAVGLYCEGLTDGPALGVALAKALARRVPVAVLAGGGVPAAAERAVSHTGNIAVPGAFWRALAERYALIEVATVKQLVETTKLLAITGAPRGRRAFIATHSGGAGALIAEQAPAGGLELPPVTAANHARVRPVLPDVITVSNPLDLNLPWASRTGMSLEDTDLIAQSLIDASEGSADAVAMFLDIPRDGAHEGPWLPSLDAMVAVRRRTGLPTVVAGILPEGIGSHLRARLQSEGVAALMGAGEAVTAMADAARYTEARDALAGAAPRPLMTPARGSPARTLDEAQSKHLLAGYGLAVPPSWAGPGVAAAAAAARIGFPVAVKVLDAAIAHKSRLGGVRLGLGSEHEVADAVAAIGAAVAAAWPGMRAERFLVEAMAPAPVAELILGVQRHPELGYGLLIGPGGVRAEALGGHRMVLLPADDAALARALGGMSDPPLTEAARVSVLSAMRAVARFAAGNAGRLIEMDVNPLLVAADGSALAVDALIVLAGAAAVAEARP